MDNHLREGEPLLADDGQPAIPGTFPPLAAGGLVSGPRMPLLADTGSPEHIIPPAGDGAPAPADDWAPGLAVCDG